MVMEDSDHADIVQVALANQDVFHVLSLSGVHAKTWHRMLQDNLLDEANEAKVNLSTCIAVLLLIMHDCLLVCCLH